MLQGNFTRFVAIWRVQSPVESTWERQYTYIYIYTYSKRMYKIQSYLGAYTLSEFAERINRATPVCWYFLGAGHPRYERRNVWQMLRSSISGNASQLQVSLYSMAIHVCQHWGRIGRNEHMHTYAIYLFCSFTKAAFGDTALWCCDWYLPTSQDSSGRLGF